MSQYHYYNSQPFQAFSQAPPPHFERVANAHGPPPLPPPPPVTPYRTPSPAPWAQPPPSPLEPLASQAPDIVLPSPTPPASGTKPKKEKDDSSFTHLDRKVLGEMLLADKDNTTAQGGHKPSVWVAIAAKLNTQLTEGSRKDTRNCQSQRDYIYRSYWKPIHDLLELSGFGWDSSRNMVTAEPDVWKEYIKAHPAAKKWQKKGWVLYELWNSYFEGTKAHGKNVVRPGRDFEGLNPRPEVGSSDSEGENEESEAVPDNQSQSRSSTGRSSGSRGLSESKRKATAPESIFAVARGLEGLTEVAREQLDSKRQAPSSKGAVLKQAISEVRKLEYLFVGDKVKVINQLTNHPTKAVTFMSVLDDDDLVEELLRSWLESE